MFSRPIKNPEDFKNAPIAMDIGDIIVYTNRLFDLALELKASDIHIEPNKEFVTIRYRESGDFIFIGKVAFDSYAMLLSRIKILANLRIDEKQKPQDGKIGYLSEKFDNEFVDIRVSIVPIVDGEKIVMRILRQDTSLLNIDKLGFAEDNHRKIHEVLKSMFGIILVAGPTGSGKSTTLFSMLKHFNPLENNISTLEDPVEYDIPFINQSQVKPQVGFDFAAGLRSLVRQDPDIIMVGEIRDKETATLAIEAALTGHLVFSTIHTNSASGTIQRLINMGVEPFLIASALKMVVSQRLVKRVCPECLEAYKIENTDLQTKIERGLEGVIEEKISDVPFYRGKGCVKCGNTGYKGRLGIHEVLVMENDYFDPLILRRASVNELEKAAKERGMLTILQDGIVKAATGKTTIEEVLQLA